MNFSEAEPGSILRHRAFLLYWGARTCASLGFMMFGVAEDHEVHPQRGRPGDLVLDDRRAVRGLRRRRPGDERGREGERERREREHAAGPLGAPSSHAFPLPRVD